MALITFSSLFVCHKKRSIRCPKCRSLETKRYGKRFLASVGKFVLRIACGRCSFIGSLRLLGNIREQEDICLQMTKESLERASLRTLGRRYGKSKNTVLKIIRRVTSGLPNSTAIHQKLLPLWSGVLVLDGKVVRVYDKLTTKLKRSSLSDDELRWMNKMRWLCGIDHGTGDLPHYALAKEESRIDLVMYFQALQQMEYPLNAVVCDGNPEIPHAAKFVFGNAIVIQRYTRHFLEDLRKLLPTEEDDPKERERLTQLIGRIKSIIEADGIEDMMERFNALKRDRSKYRSPIAKRMLKMFLSIKEDLCAHLLHPELQLPHTSNDIENLFKQLNLRLKSLGRFFHQEYARDYLNAWALLRRFTKFTDCRNGRRQRNGKAPLTLAGCDITNIDPFKLKS